MRAARVVVLIALVAASCRHERAEAPPTTGAPPAAPAPSSAATAAQPPAGATLVEQFARANRIDRVTDAWAAELRRQWDVQVAGMRVKPPPGFWEGAMASFDSDEQRRALLASLSPGISDEEMRADLEWLRRTGVLNLAAKLDEIDRLARPSHVGLVAEAQRAAVRAGADGIPATEPAPTEPPPPALSPGDLARIHRLMTAVGYGEPDALAADLISAVRQSLRETPAATWSDPALLAAARAASRHIEAAFITTFSPDEADRIAAALASPEGERHQALMERATTLVMSRSKPFADALQKHVLKAYSPIFAEGWKQIEATRSSGATGPASPG